MAKFDPGVTFTDGDTVTAASLNNIVDTLNIYSGLIADQTAIAGTVSTADLLLLADTDQGASGAANKVTIQKLLNDALTNGTFTSANLTDNLTYGTATGNRTVSTSAVITSGTITTGVIPTGTFGTTTSTAATITTGTIPTLTAGTTTGTAGIFTSGTVTTLNSTTGTVTNLSTTLAGDFTISQGTGTLGTSGVTLGTYGNASAIPFLTINAKGIITAATSGTFSSNPPANSVTFNTLSTSTTESDNVASRVAKAWVNFDGTFASSPFTIANGGIRASFNVSSVTDNGTGDYTVTFAASLTDANYAFVFSTQTDSYYNFRPVAFINETLSASAIRVRNASSTGGSPLDKDPFVFCVAVFR